MSNLDIWSSAFNALYHTHTRLYKAVMLICHTALWRSASLLFVNLLGKDFLKVVAKLFLSCSQIYTGTGGVSKALNLTLADRFTIEAVLPAARPRLRPAAIPLTLHSILAPSRKNQVIFTVVDDRLARLECVSSSPDIRDTRRICDVARVGAVPSFACHSQDTYHFMKVLITNAAL